MTNWLLRWVASGVALAIVAHLGIGVRYDHPLSLAEATVVRGLINSLIRPVLGLLTLPLNCLTMGLFGYVLNALLFFISGNLVPGFHVESITGAVLGPVLMGLISGALNFFLPDKKSKD